MNTTETVTILYTDLVGSASLKTRRGDASAHEILREVELQGFPDKYRVFPVRWQ